MPRRFDREYAIGRNAWYDEKTGCIEWMGNETTNGYGLVYFNGKRHRAHRVAWEIQNGTFPPELVADHVCRNRICINHEHIRAVTQRENAIHNSVSTPAINAAKTFCKRGHPLTAENTKISVTSGRRPARRCRVCYVAWYTANDARISAENRRRRENQNG